MEKYVIDVYNTKHLSENRSNATSKPRLDARKIAESLGYRTKLFYEYSCPFWRNDILSKTARKLYWKFENKRILVSELRLLRRKNSILFFQYPFLNKQIEKLIKPLHKRGNKIIVLFHDLNSFRFSWKNKNEMKLLKDIDVAIVHTQEMKDILVSYGVKCEIKVLNFFDYLNSYNPLVNVETQNIKVLFAGNLQKSKFLQELANVDTSEGSRFILYGKEYKSTNPSESITYKGCFDSNCIENIEGNWGLVWDGSSIDRCDGKLGDYLKINAPFKFSLSLALGIPVIVWSESAMAKYVKDLHLGICVDKLSDIETNIKELSTEEIEQIKKGVETYSNNVRKGKMLTSVLKTID